MAGGDPRSRTPRIEMTAVNASRMVGGRPFGRNPESNSPDPRADPRLPRGLRNHQGARPENADDAGARTLQIVIDRPVPLRRPASRPPPWPHSRVPLCCSSTTRSSLRMTSNASRRSTAAARSRGRQDGSIRHGLQHRLQRHGLARLRDRGARGLLDPLLGCPRRHAEPRPLLDAGRVLGAVPGS